jgi:hypothetical protein
MTVPTNPAPLPVVACEIVPEFVFHGFDAPPKGATVQADSGTWIAALAVPLALFEDVGFAVAVGNRVRALHEADETQSLADCCAYVNAIAAELRARAGVPETNFGNVGGADA